MNKNPKSYLASLSDRSFSRLLFGCGLFLSACELYKQIFLYVVINGGRYDWWFFPFQLCSLPMYLCLMLPFLREGRFKTTLYTFMQDFNLLGGLAALIIPEGFRHIHWTLTLHGYLWHILLILIGLAIAWSGRSDLSRRGFGRTIPVFVICCCIATLINIYAPGHGRADMFYITPYYPSSQPVFHEIALEIGIIPANLLYLATVCFGGYLVHQAFRFFTLQEGHLDSP